MTVGASHYRKKKAIQHCVSASMISRICLCCLIVLGFFTRAEGKASKVTSKWARKLVGHDKPRIPRVEEATLAQTMPWLFKEEWAFKQDAVSSSACTQAFSVQVFAMQHATVAAASQSCSRALKTLRLILS
jgi:hypothetical protein